MPGVYVWRSPNLREANVNCIIRIKSNSCGVGILPALVMQRIDRKDKIYQSDTNLKNDLIQLQQI
nr:hypothetical protein [Nostoc sp. EkiNYC01]